MAESRSDPSIERLNSMSQDALLAAAVRRLVKLDHTETAVGLAEASISRILRFGNWSRVDIELVVPGDHFDALTNPDVYANNQDVNDFGEPYEVHGTSLLARVFTNVLPTGVVCNDVEVKILNEAVTDDWRDQVRASIESGPSNQGRPFGIAPVLTHSGMNYRSRSEIAIAEKLELTEEILFLPNCSAISGKVSKEPDFLIFYRKRVGILEVDGPTHTGRMADDSMRDSFFQRQGIFIKHYPAEKCIQDPGWVLRDFLSLLMKSP